MRVGGAFVTFHSLLDAVRSDTSYVIKAWDHSCEQDTHESQFGANRAGFGSRFEMASLIWSKTAEMLETDISIHVARYGRSLETHL